MCGSDLQTQTPALLFWHRLHFHVSKWAMEQNILFNSLIFFLAFWFTALWEGIVCGLQSNPHSKTDHLGDNSRLDLQKLDFGLI